MSIIVKNVSYTYAPGTAFAAGALSNVSLTIEDGEFVGIMGKTGCGKTTLIQLIAGLLTPAAGDILLDGEDINGKTYNRNDLRRKVGIVFQHPEYQLFETTVERDVAFGLKHFGWSPEKVRETVKTALETVGFEFEKMRDQSPLGFSGGEKRRIAIAGVLATQPKILILDEPVAGLDPLGRAAFLKFLDELNAKGVTIIMVSHNVDALAEHAGRVIILKEGKVFRDGEKRQVFAEPEELIRNGIGISQAQQTALMLKKRGFDIPEEVISYDALIPHLIKIGKGERT